MPKLHAALLLATYTAFVSSAVAQFTAIADDFSTPGAVTGSTPDSGVGNWTNISGTSGAIISSAGVAFSPAASGEATQLNFSSSNLNTGTFYLGFDFTVSAQGTINTNDTMQTVAGYRSGSGFAAGFGVFRPSGNAQTFSSISSTTTGQFVAGITGGSSLNATTSALTTWGTVLSRGTTYRAVLGFNLDADTIQLWINPTNISSTSVSVTGITAEARGIFLRGGNASTGDLSFDNVLASTSFTTASAIPEPSATAALVGLATLGIAALRRRRRAA